MKNRIAISMILALMMIASTFAVGAGTINTYCNGGDPEQPGEGLVVEKTIWNGENWVDPLTASIGDDVRFNISISYYPVDTDPDDGDGVGYKAKNLVVNDTLPPCLEYNNSLVIKHGDDVYTEDLGVEEEGSIYWYISRDYGLNLWDNPEDGPRTLYLEFNATVIDYGENINLVKVTGFETCGQEDLYGEATATVNVPEPGNPEIDVEKKYWDEDTEQWEDGPVTLYEEEQITFYINISNTGNVPLHHVIITDVVPDFLSDAGIHVTNIGDLDPEEYYYDEFTLTVLEIDEIITGENYVNATADEEVYDEDEVEITVKPHFILTKEVWNGTGWSHYKESVRMNEKVRFKLTATYYGDDTMKCLVIGDYLDDLCLEYYETVEVNAPEYCEYPDIYYGDGEIIEVCDDFEVELEEGMIVWDWRQVGFKLNDGESVEVIFDTVVTEYCDSCENIPPQAPPKEGVDVECLPPCINPNVALGIIWGCMECTPCSGYKDMDMAFVRCCPPPTTFEKKVLDGETWEDSIETVVGSTHTFELELNYYGETNLTDVNFKDVLPCILEYVEESAVINIISGNTGSAGNLEPEISADGKTLWWNLTEVNLSDGGTITITFDVLVVGTTGSPCDECEPCECVNYAEVIAYHGCPPRVVPGFPMDDEVVITAENNCPPSIPQLKGDTSGKVGDTLSFKVFSTDSDGDNVGYIFDWGENGKTEVVIMYPEGVEQTFTHSWDSAGTYEVKVKAVDEHGSESDWSYPLSVTITEEEEPEKTLEISIPKRFYIKNVNADIKNNGPGDLTDIVWTFNITKDGLLGSFDIGSNGTINELKSGKTKSIQSGDVKLRFGKADITITAKSGELEETYTGGAYIIGRIIIIRTMPI